MIRMMMVPYGLTNYAFSVTQIPFSAYAIGSLGYVVKIPIYVYMGCVLEKIFEGGDFWGPGDTVVFVSEVVLTLGLSFIISIIAKRYVESKINKRQEVRTSELSQLA